MLKRRGVLGGAAALAMTPGKAQPQTRTGIKITRQPSIVYMPTFVMEVQGLIEAQATKLGAPSLRVEWVTFNGGGAATDALLADAVDMVNTGVGNMLLLWDRTRGRVKGVVATCAEPLVLVTREPRIKTLADFGPADRIAVPTVRVSTQAILLSIAAVGMFGKEQAAHFDPLTVQLGHPDAVAAMLNANGEVNSHFSAPPFFAEELRRVPGCHVVTDSGQILGEPLSQAVLFTTTRFAEANPIIVQAARAAVTEAVGLIRSDPAEAIRIYRKASGDPMPAEDLMAVLRMPGMTDFYDKPQGTMRFATHLFQTGILKTEPRSWKNYFLPSAHDLAGT